MGWVEAGRRFPRDIWCLAAPSLGFLAPDIYLDEFQDWSCAYAHKNAALFRRTRDDTCGFRSATMACSESPCTYIGRRNTMLVASCSATSHAPSCKAGGVCQAESSNGLPGAKYNPNWPASGPSQKRSSPP